MRNIYPLVVALLLCAPANLYGQVNVVDEAGMKQTLNGAQIPAPTAANTQTRTPEMLEKRCYDEALQNAYKVLKQNPIVGGNWDAQIEASMEEGINALGEQHRAGVLSAMINSPNESSFLNTLPGDPDKATQKILDKGFVKFAGGFDLNEVVLEAPCPGKFTTKMEQATSGTGHMLTGTISIDCECESNPGPIDAYQIMFRMPVSWVFDLSLNPAGVTPQPKLFETEWRVDRLVCCSKDRDEQEEDPGTSLDIPEATHNQVGYHYSDPIPYNSGLSITGFTGFTTTRQPGQSETDFMLGAKVRYPVTDRIAIGATSMWSNTTENFGGSIQRSCIGEVGPMAEFYTGCGSGPVRPYAALSVPIIAGTEAFDFEGNPSDPVKDNVFGFAIRADLGIATKVTDNLAIGLEVPLLEYQSIGRKPKGSDSERFNESSFFHSVNKKAPSINITYELGGGGYYYDGSGFDPTANGLLGCGNFAYWHWMSENWKESDTWLGAGLMTPVSDDVLVGGALNLGVARQRFMSGYFPDDEYTINRNPMIRGDVMAQYYPCDKGGPVQPMLGVAAHVGNDWNTNIQPGETDPFTSSQLSYGATLSAGAYFPVADCWGLLANAPLVGVNRQTSDGSGWNTWTAGANKWIMGFQVLYDIGGGKADEGF